MTSTGLTSKAMRTPGKSGKKGIELALEVSELRYRRLFETAHDGILILDANTGEIIDVNPFLLDLLEYPFENMLGLRLWEIGPFKDIAANEAAFRKLQENEYIRYEDLPLLSKSGREIQVEFVSNVYSVGSERVIQCNIRTRSRSLEECRGIIAKLEAASTTKDNGLAVLSHELRTPLTAISCATDLLELGHGLADSIDKVAPPPEFDRSNVAIIRRNLQLLARLINELLDFTHMAHGTLHLKPETVDAHEVVRLAIKNLVSQQKGTGVGIEFDLAARQSLIQIDPDKLEQVLSNLIGNGLKFTPRGGKVSIVTRNEKTGELVIEVSDNGIGIPANALRRIFQPFEQGNASIYPRFGGLGLGLSIAKSLVEAQGGTLEVESDGLNRGSKFRARFRMSDSSGPASVI